MNKEAPIVAYNFHKYVLSGFYVIEADRINTKEKLVQWVFHLSQKRWVTRDHIQELCKAAAQINHWELYVRA